ncbi:MAG TPA: ABC transporter ATP-binding protein [Candidatus Mediterraneibacter merdavium]|nr:ABC transporter ATP-binding protein [Candidatus Mediterraneibacter merdavium]
MNEKYISIRHLSKKFNKDFVLKDVNAELKRGEILGFLGPSGAGKTTTIKILTGQLRPTSGDAEVLGIASDRIDERIYEQIGIVTDISGVYERMSVYENLKYFARLLNVSLTEIDPLLKRIGLYEHRKKPAGKLSKGQTQRLILARAILHKPKVLFLDEPTSGLDPSTALEVHRMLMELKEDGMSIFLTTHNMEEATKLCDHVALLNEGVIVEYGTPQEICLKYNKVKKYKVRLTDGSDHFLIHSPESTQQITLWMNSDKIETLHTCEPTLETVFLEVTGRELQ